MIIVYMIHPLFEKVSVIYIETANCQIKHACVSVFAMLVLDGMMFA